PSIHLDQSDRRQRRHLAKASRQVESDHRPFSAQNAAFRQTERALAAGKFGARSHPITGFESRDTRTHFKNASTELMAEELEGSFGFEPAFDPVIRQGRDAKRELGLGHAGLDAERFRQNMTGPQLRTGDLIESQITK